MLIDERIFNSIRGALVKSNGLRPNEILGNYQVQNLVNSSLALQ